VRYLLFLSYFNENRNVLDRISREKKKNLQMLNSTKTCPVGDKLFHVDRRADIHSEANSGFSQFFESAYKAVSRPQHLRHVKRNAVSYED